MTLLAIVPLTARSLLARVDARIVAVRRAIRHDHRDDAYWSGFGITAREAQSQRAVLRRVANLLHVERANARGKLHGFANLDEQRAWLERMADHRCPQAARHAGLPVDATLAMLRAGALVGTP
ncbi:MAG: hypothetical protein ABI867_10675 [Kofleriaceae bacterium]